MGYFQLFPDEPKFDFIGKRFLAYAVSLLIILGAFSILFIKGLNYGIDFSGGTLIEVGIDREFNVADVRQDLAALNLGEISIQEFGDANTLLIRIGQDAKAIAEEDAGKKIQAEVTTALMQKYGEYNVDIRRAEYVGPQVGEELKRAGFWAFTLSMLGIFAYLWLRFEWQFGAAAVIALFHDMVATMGLISITGIAFDLSTLAAVLLVAGYSLNDTVVVYDRIRENLRKYRKMPILELLNLSTNQTLARSLMTSTTTLLALIALLVFGGEVIRSFTYALVFGIVIGTFSSIYVAAPLLAIFKVSRGSKDAN
ncbi:MAG: protein translocase subunit SecF [Alphaproteobacteria bacterium]|nr:protein translocase subunit SecF [Alphaproteobacteria bacterium]